MRNNYHIQGRSLSIIIKHCWPVSPDVEIDRQWFLLGDDATCVRDIVFFSCSSAYLFSISQKFTVSYQYLYLSSGTSGG
jgi:hypothetical protein